jgi:O-succinylbenzoic acid--CoA ligase
MNEKLNAYRNRGRDLLQKLRTERAFDWISDPADREAAVRAWARPQEDEREQVVVDCSSPAEFCGWLWRVMQHGRIAILREPGAELPKLGRLPLEGGIFVPTGGTSGGGKYIGHRPETLFAAALGLGDALGGPIRSVCVLPMHHVSGLMQAVRAFATDGEVLFLPWKRLEAGDVPPGLGGPGWSLSLVPTQLARLMSRPHGAELLRKFDRVFVGGASTGAEILGRARDLRLPLAPAYGATETAAQVAFLPPEEFLSGVEGVGGSLPHAEVRVDSAGRIVISAASLFLTYADGRCPGSDWMPGDLGRKDEQGRLLILGREDHRINTGGEKVQPEVVEQALRDCGCAAALVAGVPDPEWGERVGAIAEGGPAREWLDRELRTRLPRHAVPTVWLFAEVPLTKVGKPDRARGRALLAQAAKDASQSK